MVRHVRIECWMACLVALSLAGCGGAPGTDETDPLPKVFGNKDVDPSLLPSMKAGRGSGYRYMEANDQPPGDAAGAPDAAAAGADAKTDADSSGSAAAKPKDDDAGPTQP